MQQWAKEHEEKLLQAAEKLKNEKEKDTGEKNKNNKQSPASYHHLASSSSSLPLVRISEGVYLHEGKPLRIKLLNQQLVGEFQSDRKNKNFISIFFSFFSALLRLFFFFVLLSLLPLHSRWLISRQSS